MAFLIGFTQNKSHDGKHNWFTASLNRKSNNSDVTHPNGGCLMGCLSKQTFGFCIPLS